MGKGKWLYVVLAYDNATGDLLTAHTHRGGSASDAANQMCVWLELEGFDREVRIEVEGRYVHKA